MKPIHVSRPNKSGIRNLYTKCSRRHVTGGKNVLGQLFEDWCEDDRGRMVMGWYWMDLGDGFGRTFPRMRDAVADFEREMRERRAANEKRQKEQR